MRAIPYQEIRRAVGARVEGSVAKSGGEKGDSPQAGTRSSQIAVFLTQVLLLLRLITLWPSHTECRLPVALWPRESLQPTRPLASSPIRWLHRLWPGGATLPAQCAHSSLRRH